MKYLKTNIVNNTFDNEICEFIVKLSNIGLINIVDPGRHFYLDDGKIKMIDFGFVTEVNPVSKSADMEKMAELCNIKCNFSKTSTKLRPKKIPSSRLSNTTGRAGKKLSSRRRLTTRPPPKKLSSRHRPPKSLTSRRKPPKRPTTKQTRNNETYKRTWKNVTWPSKI